MDWYEIQYLTDWKKVGLYTLITVFIIGVIAITLLAIISSDVNEDEIVLTPTCEDFSRSLRGCESFYCEENDSFYNITFNPPYCIINKTTESSQTICEVLVRERQELSQRPIENLETSQYCMTTHEQLLE